MRVVQRHIDVRGPCTAFDPLRNRDLSRDVREAEPQHEVARRGLEQPHVHSDAGEISLWRKVHGVDRVSTARLEIDGLPHSARLTVPLLALELERMIAVVHTDDETLRLTGSMPRR